MKRIKQIISLWLPVVVWCTLIFSLSSIPNLRAAKNPFWDEIIRSTLHFFIYTILFLIIFRAINAFREKKNYTWATVIAILYSISDEFHQTFVPTRTFQIKDLVVNIAGICFGGFIIWKFLPRAPVKLKNWAKKFQLT